MTLRVTGREPVPDQEGRWPKAWVVLTSNGWKTWYVEEVPYVVRLEISRPDGGKDIWAFEEMETLELPPHGHR